MTAAVFTDSDKNQTTVTFYSYDTNYYAAVVDNKVFLVNKMTVKKKCSMHMKPW